MAVLSSCTVRLVADYDETIDQGVTELHRETTAFLLDMADKAGTPEGEYRNNKDFYVQSRAMTASLVLRADSSPQNSITARELKLLESSFGLLAEAHEAQGAQGITADFVSVASIPFDVHFGAILRFEIAKKRGK